MFRFLQAVQVKRSYLWVCALLAGLGLASGIYCLWQLNLKIACSDAEQPEQSESSLPIPIGQANGRMEVHRVDSAIQVEENNPLTPSSAVLSLPPISSTLPTLPTQTPSNPITPIASAPSILSNLERPRLPLLPPPLLSLTWRLKNLKIIDQNTDVTWITHQSQYNTTSWSLILNLDQMALNSEPVHRPIYRIVIPKSWDKNEYNNSCQDLGVLQKLTGQAPVVVHGLCLDYGPASFKLLLLLLRILNMPRVEIRMNSQVLHSEDIQTTRMLAGIDYLLDDLPEDISGRETLLRVHTPNTVEYWREILKLVIQTYSKLELRKCPVKLK
ncbi:hypothetical protein NEHOM01_0435 [Nematocida homosporus]|uniref:uncharacterized protein n=1 Tax=Nematocida homosporus TaxID=1912981 RepID=UPI002220CA36|nr:uncharacterized protein NEHOM01_0435 [Nematocida homosporus]KAI5184833.1 hypothetical protein NEHOM01_0435 [Nematocida homosporus]